MKHTNIDGIELWQFNDIMGELGYYDQQIHPMDGIDEFFIESAYDALLSAFFGGRFGCPGESFNPNDDFFTFNGRGNLISIYKYSLQDYLDEFSDDILDYVNTNEIELWGLEEEEEEEEED